MTDDELRQAINKAVETGVFGQDSDPNSRRRIRAGWEWAADRAEISDEGRKTIWIEALKGLVAAVIGGVSAWIASGHWPTK